MRNDAALLTESLAGSALVYSNASGAAFTYQPDAFEVRLCGTALRHYFGLPRRVTLTAPSGWMVAAPNRLVLDEERTVTWRVVPGGVPPSCLAGLTLQIDRGDGRLADWVLAVPIELHAVSQFELVRHRLPFANAPHEAGEVAPNPASFAATYQRGGPLAQAFYRGLYSEVVYLTADPSRPRPGGLCTGMARSSLEFSLEDHDDRLADRPREQLHEAAVLWHGRQLADRALLASTAAWLRQGSRTAYARFRQRLLDTGRTDLAFDVNVPRPWRRDVLTAFIGSGHTVVPYALRQTSDDRAEVWVYDPNYPHEPEASRSVVSFDLANDTFHYRHFHGDVAGRPSKVIAVDQAHYRAATTGYISSVLSAILYPHSWWTPPRRSLTATLAVGVAALAGLVAARRTMRSPSIGAVVVGTPPVTHHPMTVDPAS